MRKNIIDNMKIYLYIGSLDNPATKEEVEKHLQKKFDSLNREPNRTQKNKKVIA